jgi:hypothetical protein
MKRADIIREEHAYISLIFEMDRRDIERRLNKWIIDTYNKGKEQEETKEKKGRNKT